MIPLTNVLVADPVSEKCLDLLKKHGINATAKYKLTKEQLISVINDYDGLIVRSETKVTKEVLLAANRLKVVGRAGTGVDNIDIPTATQKGIIVLNTPGGNSISACELTCALISALARNVGGGCISMKEGRWDRKLFMGTELLGKTLGVIGLGRIGREVALRMQSFGMTTIGFDPIVTEADAASFNVTKLSLDQLWSRADYITVHTPLIPQTKNLINNETFNKCKKGVQIINVARGGIVNEDDLLVALNDGRCGGAGLDVFTEEPPKSDKLWNLIKHPKVLATPHLGASTEEAQVRVAVEIAEQFIALAKPSSGFEVSGAVNAPVLSTMKEPRNAKLLELASQLGLLGIKIFTGVPLNEISISITSTGEKELKSLELGLLKGVLSYLDPNVNMINVKGKAADSGLGNVKYSHINSAKHGDSVEVTFAQKANRHTLAGCLIGDEICLKSIDDSVFCLPPPLRSEGIIFSCKDTSTVNKLFDGVIKEHKLHFMAIATGSTKWLYIVPDK